MMLARASRAVLPLLLLGAACSEDVLQKRVGHAVLTPRPEGIQTALTSPPGVDYGEVPLFAVATATFQVENLGSAALAIEGARIEDAVGGTFAVTEFPTFLAAGASGQLSVSFAPQDHDVIGKATVALDTTGGQRGDEVVRGQLRGVGVFLGAPNIEVCYGGLCFPQPVHCTPRPDGQNQCTLPPLSFGNVPFEQTANQEIRIRNAPPADTCQPIPGMAACDPVCQLIVDKNPAGQNVGAAILPADVGFGIGGNVPIPFSVDMVKPECGDTGEVRVVLTFTAGSVEADLTASLVLETNDPDAPFLEIPMTAAARKAPVAVAKVRVCGLEDPLPNCTLPDEVRPLDRVFVDGRDSYDPDRPTDPSALVAYAWEVIDYPAGANPEDFAFEGGDTPLASFFLPIAGVYKVRLSVTNDNNVTSGVSPTSDVVVVAVPASRVHVELTWANPQNDMDLHLALANDGHRVCRGTDDCFWRNCAASCLDNPDCTPLIWYPGLPYAGPNPHLDIDDTDGLGPENINVDEPNAGRYRIYVHHYALLHPDTQPTTNTVRVYLDGVLRAEFRRVLDRNDLWRVADIVWTADGGGTIELLDDDGLGVGMVRKMNACTGEGFTFVE